jgi:hypothetical protein
MIKTPAMDFDELIENSTNDEAVLRASRALYAYLFSDGGHSLQDEACQPLLNDWAVVTGNNLDRKKKQDAELKAVDGDESVKTPEAMKADAERSMAFHMAQYEQDQREHLRSAARELLSRAHINLSKNLTITGGGHDRTITATFDVTPGADVPTIAGITIGVRFGWATCDDALKGLDAVLSTITNALEPAYSANGGTE